MDRRKRNEKTSRKLSAAILAGTILFACPAYAWLANTFFWKNTLTQLLLLAGNVGGIGDLNGTGATASFNAPLGIAFDSAGNAYIADSKNNCIRKMTSSGLVTTLAGSGIAGHADGPGTAASFSTPVGVAVDSANNVYVADQTNDLIRKISPSGVVSTIAGAAGTAGNSNGTGTGATFWQPNGLATDGTNLYVADRSNNLIRQIVLSTGVVTTLAGSTSSGSANGTGTAASFNQPTGIAIDPTLTYLYVTDSGNYTIRKIVISSAAVTTLAGTAGTSGTNNATGLAATFASPTGIAVDGSGNIYVADELSPTIRKVTSSGVVTTLAGSGSVGSANAIGTGASFRTPQGLAVDSSGDILVADTGNNLIREVASSNANVTTVAGSLQISGSANGTLSAANFYNPGGLVVDSSGNVYVADTGNNLIRKVTAAGVVTTFAGSGAAGSTNATGTDAQFNGPNGLAIDSSNNIYVADTGNNLVRKITSGAVVTTLAGSGSAGSLNGTGTGASFKNPEGVAVDTFGNVYVADKGNNLVRMITSAGYVTTLAGSGSAGYTDGNGTAAAFSSPSAIGYNTSNSSLYVADTSNYRIRKVTTLGVVTTFAGSGTSGYADGTGASASFTTLNSLVVDGSGNLYVSDLNNNLIRKVNPSGVVTTVVGQISSIGNLTGAPLPASLYTPLGVGLSASKLYISVPHGILYCSKP